MPYIELENKKIHFESRGRGNKLLVLHDGLLDSSAWQAQVDFLSHTHEVITYDRRGYGESDSPTTPYSNLEDLEYITNHLGIDKATIISGSMGGGLAIDFTIKHAERVSGLVLIGAVISGLPYSHHMSNRNQKNYKPLIDDKDVEGCIRAWSNDKFLISKNNHKARSAFLRIMLKNYKNIINNPALIKQNEICPIDLLEKINAPTLILVGEDDIPDVHAQSGILENMIKTSKRIVIENCGHLAYLEQPNEVNRLIGDFMISQIHNEPWTDKACGPTRI